MMLEARELSVNFGSHPAVEHATIRFEPGEMVALLGPNGAGKSTLIRALAGLVAHKGNVFLGDRSLHELDRKSRARSISYLPQAPSAPWPLTAQEIVALGRLPHLPFGRSLGERDRAAIQSAMRAVDVDGLADRPISELSGGELMRVHLARVLAVDAPVLLVDEPVANLDPAHQLLAMETLRSYAARGRCVVAVMHDLTLAARYCGRAVLMRAGTIAADGPSADVLDRATIGEVYRIQAIIDRADGVPLVVPWARIAGEP